MVRLLFLRINAGPKGIHQIDYPWWRGGCFGFRDLTISKASDAWILEPVLARHSGSTHCRLCFGRRPAMSKRKRQQQVWPLRSFSLADLPKFPVIFPCNFSEIRLLFLAQSPPSANFAEFCESEIGIFSSNRAHLQVRATNILQSLQNFCCFSYLAFPQAVVRVPRQR
jgi:hypothetical protein